MKQVRTHYDNLKVARDAPAEVIRAAYKSLSQKFHPDRNPGNHEAARIMVLINAAYEVLSDSDKRKEHDLWIAQQELVQAEKINSAPHSTSRPAPAQQHSILRSNIGDVIAHVFRYWLLYGLAGFFIWIWVNDKPSTPPPGPKPYQATPAPVRPAYVRSNVAPNGQPWPVSAGYVGGYQRLHADGLSTVTVDNSQNDSDAFVKLVSLDGAKAYPVRQFYIPAFGRFTLKKVTAGSYDIRYRDLRSGGLSRSEAFNLEETPANNGTQYSIMTMTLYKVQHGNMKTYGLSETEF